MLRTFQEMHGHISEEDKIKFIKFINNYANELLNLILSSESNNGIIPFLKDRANCNKIYDQLARMITRDSTLLDLINKQSYSEKILRDLLVLITETTFGSSALGDIRSVYLNDFLGNKVYNTFIDSAKYWSNSEIFPSLKSTHARLRASELKPIDDKKINLEDNDCKIYTYNQASQTYSELTDFYELTKLNGARSQNDIELAKKYNIEVMNSSRQNTKAFASRKELQEQLNHAIAIPNAKKVYHDFLGYPFTHVSNPHMHNITNTFVLNNSARNNEREPITDKEKIRLHIKAITDEYANITTSSYFHDYIDSQLAKELRSYCERNYYIELPEILKNPKEIKFKPEYFLLTNEPIDGCYVLQPSCEDLNGLLLAIKSSLQNDWRNQTIFKDSDPDGIDAIKHSLLNFNETENPQDLKNIILETQATCKKRLEKNMLTRSDITNDFYKIIESIDLDNKYSFKQTIESLTAIDHRLEASHHKHQGYVLRH